MPRTEAGKALHLMKHRREPESAYEGCGLVDAIAAIEAEAVAAYAARLREAVEELPGVKYGRRRAEGQVYRIPVLDLIEEATGD